MTALELEWVDAGTLDPQHRELLQPGESPGNGFPPYPRYFYVLPSWEIANKLFLTPRFRLAELMTVDCREAELLLRSFPPYVPCGIIHLAHFLELLRREAGAPIFISANGGYRSPAHQYNGGPTAHSWAAAADIYRVGDTYLDDEKSLARYAEMARTLSAAINARGAGDHLHIDLGFSERIPEVLGTRQSAPAS